MTEEYRANFLWPYEPDSIEQYGYEFANAKTEAWQKEQWELLIETIREQVKKELNS